MLKHGGGTQSLERRRSDWFLTSEMVSSKKKIKESKFNITLAEASEVVKKVEKPTKLRRPAKAYLVGDKAVVEDEEYEIALPLYSEKQFGEKHGVKKKRLEFALNETLYLIEREKLEVFSTPNSKKPLDLAAFVKLASKLEKKFWTRYRVYRELRTRGYIVKTALKFGADFRVYDRGKKPGEVHAKWVLFATNEHDIFTWREFAAMNRVAHSTKKKLLIGVVDDEGDVTYWLAHWKKP